MAQQDLIEKLNREVIEQAKANELLELRIKRLEQTIEQLVGAVFVPQNEKPPHY
jgi:uncharacterized coiled-coil protein SlyX